MGESPAAVFVYVSEEKDAAITAASSRPSLVKTLFKAEACGAVSVLHKESEFHYSSFGAFDAAFGQILPKQHENRINVQARKGIYRGNYRFENNIWAENSFYSERREQFYVRALSKVWF